MELERSTVIFLILIGIVFLGSFFVKESFVDASGGFVQVSIKDLISLLQNSGIQTQTQKQTQTTTPTPASKDTNYDASHEDILKKQQETLPLSGTVQDKPVNTTEGNDYYSAFKTEILQEVRQSVRDELQKKQEGSVMSDSCIDSVANQQGTDWMRYIPGKNPADYIRKDSIPCYGCNLA